MNDLRVSDPFSLDSMSDPISALMRPWRLDLADTAPRIKIDVSEQDGSYAVKAEIPGVSKEDIDVRIDGNLVTISAETKSEKQEKDKGRILRQERRHGYASRAFTLACPVDEAKAEAQYKDGVLELRLPKKAGDSAKHLTIR